MAYARGALVRCTGTWTDITGAAVDPTTVGFEIKTPAGAITIYTYGTDAALVKDSTGVYHVDVSATSGGPWTARFYSTGTGQAAQEKTFQVDGGAF